MKPLELLTLLFNRFDELDVQKRVLLMKDRSVSVRNITSISVDRVPLYPYILALLLPGLFIAGEALATVASGGNARGAFQQGWVDGLIMQSPWLLAALLLIGLFWYTARRRRHFLRISSSDGAQYAFGSRDVELLRGVKAALDDKINNGRVAVTFFTNFAASEQGGVAVPSADMVVPGLRGAMPGGERFAAARQFGNRRRVPGGGAVVAGAMNGEQRDEWPNPDPAQRRGDKDNSRGDVGAGEQPWYDKAFDLPLNKTNELLSKFARGEMQGNMGGVVSLMNEVSQPMNKGAAVAYGAGATPDEGAGAVNGHVAAAAAHPVTSEVIEPIEVVEPLRVGEPHLASNVIGFHYPPGGAAQSALSPMWDAQEGGVSEPPAPEGGGEEVTANGGMQPGSPGPGEDAGLVQAEAARLIDYSAQIPNVETIRRELTDPIITGKLDEMIALMEGGTPGEAEKSRLRAHALTLAGYVRAYPQIARIFEDILDTAAS